MVYFHNNVSKINLFCLKVPRILFRIPELPDSADQEWANKFTDCLWIGKIFEKDLGSWKNFFKWITFVNYACLLAKFGALWCKYLCKQSKMGTEIFKIAFWNLTEACHFKISFKNTLASEVLFGAKPSIKISPWNLLPPI